MDDSEKKRIRDIHAMDQGTEFVGEFFPPLLWKLYKGCVRKGFTSEQAIELTKTYLYALISIPSSNPDNLK